MTTAATPARAPRKPQDRKPKATEGYSFEVAGKSYSLPKIGEGLMEKIEGGVVESAMLDGPQGEIKLAFALLRSIEGHDEAVDALRSLNFKAMSEHLLGWMQTAGEPGK